MAEKNNNVEEWVRFVDNTVDKMEDELDGKIGHRKSKIEIAMHEGADKLKRNIRKKSKLKPVRIASFFPVSTHTTFFAAS